MLFSSLYLAGTIAEPVKRLAAAADRVRFGLGGRSDIPNFPERTDEIGDLADSLRSMTAGLYDRIDAIESFAADVAHELKNPLTSLASAVEMLVRAPDDTARQKLMTMVRADRSPRLVANTIPADVAALSALPLSQDGFGPTCRGRAHGLIGKIGENMSIRRFKRYAGGGRLASYLHGTRIGVLVEYEGDETAAKDVAMHVAAMKPKALTTADVASR